MLDRIASLFEAEESSEEGRAFDIGCVIAVAALVRLSVNFPA